MSFGSRMKKRREELGLSRTVLAERLGVSRQAVSKWESGKAVPESDTLISISEYFGKLDIQVDPSEILITTGGGEALDMVMACILDDEDELLVPEPFYANYNTFARVTGGKIRPIPTSADNGYRYADRELIESLINEHTRGIMITNPGNPTGVVLTDEEMRLLVDIAKEHDLFLIGD